MVEAAPVAIAETYGTTLIETAGVARVATPGPCRRVILRGAANVAAAAGAVLRFAVPTVPCRAATDGRGAVLWLGPDEWLLLLPPANLDDGLQQVLADALTALPHALVDVSDRSRSLAVDGPGAEDVLRAACPLDLDIDAFPVGLCTRTLFGKAEIVLWRTADRTFHVEVARSFIPYVVDLLRVAAADAALIAAPAIP